SSESASSASGLGCRRYTTTLTGMPTAQPTHDRQARHPQIPPHNPPTASTGPLPLAAPAITKAADANPSGMLTTPAAMPATRPTNHNVEPPPPPPAPALLSLAAALGVRAGGSVGGGAFFSGATAATGVGCGGLDSAVERGFGWASPDGVVLLSPAAPSFGAF